MSKEIMQNEGLDNIRKFKGLFDFINSEKLDKEYKDAYDYAVNIAKELVDTKSKDSWDDNEFENRISSEYPGISIEFINTLKNCIKNYNPPVNLPNSPLWE